jgi:hypothetical protein
LYKAAAEYYILKETGETSGGHTAAYIMEELFRALHEAKQYRKQDEPSTDSPNIKHDNVDIEHGF